MMMDVIRSRWGQAAVVAVLFVLTGKLGQLLAIPPGLATPVWLPSGITTAAAILWGYHVGFGIFAGAVWITWTEIGSAGVADAVIGPVSTTLLIGIGVTAESLLAAYFYRRIWQRSSFLSNAWNVGYFLLSVVPLSCFLSALVASVALAWAGLLAPDRVAPTLLTWLIGDAAGIYAITPLLVVWSESSPARLSENDRAVGIAAGLALLAAASVAFFDVPPIRKSAPMDFLPFPIMVFIAYRFGDRIAALVGPAVAALAIAGALLGQGSFGGEAMNQSLLSIQVFVLVGILTALCTRALANERDVAEAEARRLGSDLAHASRVAMMGELAAGMAHEYHQPLAAISNYASASLKRLRGHDAAYDEVHEAIERITEESTRAAEIVERMRSFLQKREPSRAPCDPNEIVADAVHLTRMTHAFPGVTLDYSTSPDLPEIEMDRIQITQILVNLIVNSMEAIAASGEARGEVRVVVFRASYDWLRIYVEDTGPGLDDETARACFDQFYSTKAGGLGIGLGISKTLAENHGGRLFLEQSSDAGARFCLELPVHE